MKRKLMFIYAHPDDETFASGGTIARYALQSDCEIVLFCTTRGEAGKPGNPPLCTQEELGEVRSRELEAAAQVLGIDRVILRDYGDGRLSEDPLFSNWWTRLPARSNWKHPRLWSPFHLTEFPVTRIIKSSNEPPGKLSPA